jgi:hypothetical protein
MILPSSRWIDVGRALPLDAQQLVDAREHVLLGLPELGRRVVDGTGFTPAR